MNHSVRIYIASLYIDNNMSRIDNRKNRRDFNYITIMQINLICLYSVYFIPWIIVVPSYFNIIIILFYELKIKDH